MDYTMKIAERYDTLCENKSTNYKLLLILLRFCIREVIADINFLNDEWGYYLRQKEILKRKSMFVPFLDAKIEQTKENYNKVKEFLVHLGGQTILIMDMWQDSGATLKDMADLCGRPYQQFLDTVNSLKDAPGKLSEMMEIYGLDYQDNGSGFYDFTQDGPFTHATKEFLLDQMRNTTIGRMAAHEALVQVFPEIWDNWIMPVVDCEGNKVFIDNDGEIVGYIQE